MSGRPHLPLLERHEEDHTKCAFCPKMCRFACPVSEAEPRETLTPWGKMTLLHVVAEGTHAFEPSTAAAFWACSGCMRCRTHCVHGNEVADALRSGRAEALGAGLAPPAATKMIEDFSAREEAARAVAKGLDANAPDAPPSGDLDASRVAYFPGCSALLSEPGDVTATLALVRRLAEGPVALEAGACCGLPLLHAGDEAGFRRAAEALGRRLVSRSTLIVGDPGCAFALKVLYRERELWVPPDPVVLAEWVAARLGLLGGVPRAGTAVYHDPCHLGRGLGVYDAPREILRHLVSEVVEMPHARQDAECCGGGGGLPRTMSDVARRIALRRLEDSAEVGATLVVTACPSCKRQLRKGANRSGDGIEVRDLFELASALPP
jgi:Fe-S oxidoreductase